MRSPAFTRRTSTCPVDGGTVALGGKADAFGLVRSKATPLIR
ncbi:hypothetical protein BCO37747_06897 [Burkholderia contaminans]|nr:hypothetical protein BCO23253_06531 [Burkholderia contaminans]VWD57779.1 hypothetical protein BCO37747_06897 [Burkholderia contaminans]